MVVVLVMINAIAVTFCPEFIHRLYSVVAGAKEGGTNDDEWRGQGWMASSESYVYTARSKMAGGGGGRVERLCGEKRRRVGFAGGRRKDVM